MSFTGPTCEILVKKSSVLTIDWALYGAYAQSSVVREGVRTGAYRDNPKGAGFKGREGSEWLRRQSLPLRGHEHALV